MKSIKLKSDDIVSCKIENEFIPKAIVEIEGDKIYFCQNSKKGSVCENQHGFSFSWVQNGSVTDIRLIDSYEKSIVINKNLYLEYFRNQYQLIIIIDNDIKIILFADEEVEKFIENYNKSYSTKDDFMCNIGEHKIGFFLNETNKIYNIRLLNIKENFFVDFSPSSFERLFKGFCSIIEEKTNKLKLEEIKKNDIKFKDISEFENQPDPITGTINITSPSINQRIVGIL
jgi:hypothetical protein